MSTPVKVVGALGRGKTLAEAIQSYYAAQTSISTSRVFVGVTSVSKEPHAVAVASGETLEYTPFRDGPVHYCPGAESTPSLAVACGERTDLCAATCKSCSTVAVASSPVALQTCSNCGSSKMDSDPDSHATASALIFDGVPLVASAEVSTSAQRRSLAQPNNKATIPSLDDLIATLDSSNSGSLAYDIEDDEETVTAAPRTGIMEARTNLAAALSAAGLTSRQANLIVNRLQSCEKAVSSKTLCPHLQSGGQGVKAMAGVAMGDNAVTGVMRLFENVITGRNSSPGAGESSVTLERLLSGEMSGLRKQSGSLVQMLYLLASELDKLYTKNQVSLDGRRIPGINSAFSKYLTAVKASVEGTKVATAAPAAVAADMSDVDLASLTANDMRASGCRKQPVSEAGAVPVDGDDPTQYIAAWQALGYSEEDEDDPDYVNNLIPEPDEDDDRYYGEGIRQDDDDVGEMGDSISELPAVRAPGAGSASQMLGSEDMIALDMLASAIPPGTPGNPSIEFTYSQASGDRPSRWWVMQSGMPVGYATKETVAPALRANFDTPSFQLSMSSAVSATTDAYTLLVGNGFQSHQVQLPIAPIIRERVGSAVETAYATAAANAAEQNRRTVSLIEVGLMAVEKQYYANVTSPLRDALVAEASAVGIAPAKMALALDKALQNGCLPRWIDAGMQIANNLQTQPEQVIQGTAVAVASAPYKATPISGYATSEPQQISAPMLPVATQAPAPAAVSVSSAKPRMGAPMQGTALARLLDAAAKR